jgi:hypothetical protein
VGHEVFVLFADVEEDAVEAVGEDLAEFESGDFGKRSHFFFVDEWFGDAGVLTAKRAVGIAFDFDFAEGGGEGAVVDETTEGRLADLREELDRFHRLEAANDSREHAQDTCFGSGGDGAIGRGFREEAAVAGAPEVGGKDGDLAFELENRSVDEGLFEKVSGVVGGEAGGEVIGAIEEGVVGGEEVEGVFRFEASGVEDDFDVGINLMNAGLGTFELRGADAVGVV